MPHAETVDHGPQLSPSGRRSVDEVVATMRIVHMENPDLTRQEACILTHAAMVNADTGMRMLHDPSDPMSRAG